MTEFGFETNPPDPFSGVPLAAQAQFNTIGEYQAWQNPRIASQAQFLLRDVAPGHAARRRTRRRTGSPTSRGSTAATGSPKPAATRVRDAVPRVQPSALGPGDRRAGLQLLGPAALPAQRRRRTSATIQWRPKDGSTPWITRRRPDPGRPAWATSRPPRRRRSRSSASGARRWSTRPTARRPRRQPAGELRRASALARPSRRAGATADVTRG